MHYKLSFLFFPHFLFTNIHNFSQVYTFLFHYIIKKCISTFCNNNFTYTITKCTIVVSPSITSSPVTIMWFIMTRRKRKEMYGTALKGLMSHAELRIKTEARKLPYQSLYCLTTQGSSHLGKVPRNCTTNKLDAFISSTANKTKGTVTFPGKWVTLLVTAVLSLCWFVATAFNNLNSKLPVVPILRSFRKADMWQNVSTCVRP